MSFGEMPIANSFILRKEQKQFFFNLKIGYCTNCYTFQVIEIPKAEKMFNENYISSIYIIIDEKTLGGIG